MTWASCQACQARLAAPNPPSVHSPAKTGVVQDSPGASVSWPESSWPIPPTTWTAPSESRWTAIRQDPDQASAQLWTSPLSSVASPPSSATQGRWWWLVWPRRLPITCSPGVRRVRAIRLSAAQRP